VLGISKTPSIENISNSYSLDSSIVIDKNGCVYTCGNDALYCFYQDCSLKCIYPNNSAYGPNSNTYFNPIIGYDGIIYHGCDDDNINITSLLFANYPNGQLKWKIIIDGFIDDSMVLFGINNILIISMFWIFFRKIYCFLFCYKNSNIFPFISKNKYKHFVIINIITTKINIIYYYFYLYSLLI
jgi:outer membrane protein assembly factor BamB